MTNVVFEVVGRNPDLTQSPGVVVVDRTLCLPTPLPKETLPVFLTCRLGSILRVKTH